VRVQARTIALTQSLSRLFVPSICAQLSDQFVANIFLALLVRHLFLTARQEHARFDPQKARCDD
jgi:hypothetical protein